jgi:hypothetical protein
MQTDVTPEHARKTFQTMLGWLSRNGIRAISRDTRGDLDIGDLLFIDSERTDGGASILGAGFREMERELAR